MRFSRQMTVMFMQIYKPIVSALDKLTNSKAAMLVLYGLLAAPAFTLSASNTTVFNQRESCPVLPEGAAGQSFHFKLPYLKKEILANRFANLWFGAEKQILETKTIIFYWHGTDGTTDEIDTAFGKNGVQQLLDRGYIVVSPDHIRNAKGDGILKYSWYIANGSRLNHDVVFGDQIVECLNTRFNTRFRVITTGCSAGAMQSALWSFQNQDIVGIILYSGGIFRLPPFVSRQNFWSVITHGGVADKRGDFNFMNTAIHIHNQVLKLGYPSALCDFTPQGHDIHPQIANILPQIILKAADTELPAQCSKKRY